MKIYFYNPTTKTYQGEGTAKLSPLDLKQGKEVYMIPAHATDVEPPEHIEGKHRTFVNGAWEYYDIPTPEPEKPPTEEQLLQMQIRETKRELSLLDNARDAEDIFNALKAKGILKDSDLPTATVTRLNRKVELRQQLQQLGG